MQTTFECIPCILQTVIKIFNKNIIPIEKRENIFRNILIKLSEEDLKYSPPFIAQKIHKYLKKESGIDDIYAKEKKEYNDICLSLYNDINKLIEKSNNKLETAIKFSVVANIIDFGTHHSFNIIETLKNIDNLKFGINQTEVLIHDIDKAKNILILGDNSGEIVFDKILLEHINRPQDIYYAVRGENIINDITRETAKYVGIDKYAIVIDNGSDIPGTVLEKTSDSFSKIFNQVDLIISKGQGNYESLSEYKKKKIYFLLMAKCDIAASHLNVNKGELIVKSNII